MDRLQITPSGHDFSGLHAAMRRPVQGNLLAGVSSAVLVGQDLVDLHCEGLADRESGEPLRTDHLFRVFSNTKLLTSMAVLMLHEQGAVDLDEPVHRHLPQLAQRRVLRPGAQSLDDNEPAQADITLRHLLTHTAGLSYGVLDPGSLMFKAYVAAQVNHPMSSLAQMMDALAPLPLVFHPGRGWEYSIATDVVARLVEVLSGMRFGDYLRQHILGPLGMHDTGFVVPPAEQHRLTAMYAGADLFAPMTPGLTRMDHHPFPQAYRVAVPRQSGGGGLVSSLGDWVTLLRSLLPGGQALLKPATLRLMMTDQLPAGLNVRFVGLGEMPWQGHGLAGGVWRQAGPREPAAMAGQFAWGGIAGTHWWIHPAHGIAGIDMAQRHMGFSHPFAAELRLEVYRALKLAS
ncbi:MAG: serine hydrolase domain-containing protein [Aquabacterium sp.]